MPKILSTFGKALEVFKPDVRDVKDYIKDNKAMIVASSTDDIALGVPADVPGAFADLSLGLQNPEGSALLTPLSGVSTGQATNVHALQNYLPQSGILRNAKALSSVRGMFVLPPLGMHSIVSADALNAATMFTDSITASNPTFVGGSTKFAAFLDMEANLTRAVRNAVNRGTVYTDGSQTERLVVQYSYTRDLLWLQEFINELARIMGWHTWALKYQDVETSLFDTGLFSDPDFSTKMETLIKIVSDFRTLDSDSHTKAQFLGDYHVEEATAMRIPTINLPFVMQGNCFYTNAAAVLGVPINGLSPIGYRLTSTRVRSRVGTIFAALELRSLHGAGLARTLIGMTIADALAVIDNLIALVRTINTGYASLVKFFDTIEAKNIYKPTSLGNTLYAKDGKLQAVEPYKSFVHDAMVEGIPKVHVTDNDVPRILAKCLIDFTTGNTFLGTAGVFESIIQNDVGNVVRMGVDANEKTDNLNEFYYQIWTPLSFLSANAKDIDGLYRFMNPFDGLTFMPDAPYDSITAAGGLSVAGSLWRLDTAVNIGLYHVTLERRKGFMPYVYDGTAGAWLRVAEVGTPVICDLLDLGGSTAVASDLLETYAKNLAQQIHSRILFGKHYVWIGAEDTLGEIGFAVSVDVASNPDTFYVSVDNRFFKSVNTNYYASIFPSINNIVASK